MKIIKKSVVILLTLAFCMPAIAEETATTETLYQRLGGEEGINEIVKGTLERHLANPEVAPYFQHLDLDWLQQSVVAFFSAGTGGPNHYTGRDMLATHAHLKVSDEIFDSTIADVLDAVKASGADQQAHDEVQAILLSFKPQIVTN